MKNEVRWDKHRRKLLNKKFTKRDRRSEVRKWKLV